MKATKRIVSLLLVAIMICSMLSVFAITSSAAKPLTHLVQTEAKWKYYIGGGTLYNTGCGIFSMRNAIGYLTGYDIGIDAPARWAHSIGAYNVTGGEGTYRLVLYPKITAKYGAKAGFTVVSESNWAGSSSTKLKNHLANGGVAIGHVPGHFIALVDYNYNTNKFHVLDSAPSTARGTTSGYGDCWVTQSRLNTGKLKLDWFCLLSATGIPADEQDQTPDEKALLKAAIETAETKRYDSYSASGITAFRSAYDNAVSVYNNSASTSANYKTARTNLETAMKASTVSVISKGKSYTMTNVWSSTPNDGVKLTDGDKGNSDGGNGKFVGAKGTEIVVDLGSAQNANMFKIYMAAGDYGVAVPFDDQLKLEVSYSNNNSTFTPLVSASNAVRTGITNGNWQTLTLTASVDTAVNARYIKFKVESTATNNFVWLDEVEVMSGDPLLSGNVYINGINSKIGSGDCHIFTPSFGTITVDNANHAWTANVVAKWDASQNGYVVKSKSFGNGTSTPSVTLASDEIFIAANNWESGVTDGSAVKGSAANTNTLNSVQVGDLITLDGINVSSNKLSVAAYAKLKSNSTSTEAHTHTPGEETCTGGQICLTCGVVLKEAKGHDKGHWELEENIQHLKCTKCEEVLKTETVQIQGVGVVKPEPGEGVVGDINDNGKVDARDYLLLKRAYFGTYELTCDDAIADINGNGKLDARDYLLLKRAYFGTYTIGE
ncbi:MAG: discoidin domain-containing protein [Clostridia bacterium]|nr:discoidin domain-containing protein [Clostridia bacterium]